ncbi:MAG: CGNR zinc finger domain-containing protein [Thermodesulfobacteriota bacterium]|nr:CGNR zinc finger domain-containing protein [Thermodesulfobacteriota bacterium]
MGSEPGDPFRRWYDMKFCGNRAKASRFYQKRSRT